MAKVISIGETCGVILVCLGILGGLPDSLTAQEAASSNLEFPTTIKVLRVAPGEDKTVCDVDRPFDNIYEINFKEYVRDVLPNEFPPDFLEEALKAGAMAVKTYAWDRVKYPRADYKYKGQQYNVRDDVCDQLYIPGSSLKYVNRSTNQAIEKTWNWVMTQKEDIFLSHHYRNCSPGDCMSQTGAQDWANQGKDWAQILHCYYDPIEPCVLNDNPLHLTKLNELGGCSISAGQGDDPEIQGKFNTAYITDGDVTQLGCAVNPVVNVNNDYYKDSLTNPIFKVFYQHLQGGESTQSQISFVRNYTTGADYQPEAYSVKFGFYKIYQSKDEGYPKKDPKYVGSGFPVYSLLVAPTDFEHHAPTPSAAGTSYNWQPFIKGSMYYYISSPIGNGSFNGRVTYIWGDVADRYELEGGRTGSLGLPLYTQLHYGPYGEGDYDYQYFEKGFIWFAKFAKLGGQRMTYAYRWTGNSVFESGNWVPLGWCNHSAGLPLKCTPPQ